MNVQKLAKVLALAASDNDSEALHALRTARRLLDAAGSDFVALAARLAASSGSLGGDEAIEDLEDAIFDLRGELRALRGENERLKAEMSGAARGGGLAEAAEAVAAAIRLRTWVAELSEDLETERSEALRHRAQAAQLSRQLEEAEAERRRLALLAQALRAKLDARVEECGPLAPEVPFAAEIRPAKRRRRVGGRTEKSLAQYALF